MISAGYSEAMSATDSDPCRPLFVDERNLLPLANLEADGFPVESFAKHLGHKVTVRGMTSSSGTRAVFKVRSIDTVAETCGPQHEN